MNSHRNGERHFVQTEESDSGRCIQKVHGHASHCWCLGDHQCDSCGRDLLVRITGARKLHVSRRLAKAIARRDRGREPGEGDPLFCSLRTGLALTPSGISLALRRLGRVAGVQVSPHMLRSTFATLSLRAGMNPLHLQELLGHSTLEMTKRYMQMVEDDLREAHARFGPVDHWLVDLL